MVLKSLKDLEAVMKLCAKHGIRTVKVGNIEMQVELPTPQDATAPEASVPTQAPKYSDEDHLFWSAGNPTEG